MSEEIDLPDAVEEFMSALMDGEYASIALVAVDLHGNTEVTTACTDEDGRAMVVALAEVLGAEIERFH